MFLENCLVQVPLCRIIAHSISSNGGIWLYPLKLVPRKLLRLHPDHRIPCNKPLPFLFLPPQQYLPLQLLIARSISLGVWHSFNKTPILIPWLLHSPQSSARQFANPVTECETQHHLSSREPDDREHYSPGTQSLQTFFCWGQTPNRCTAPIPCVYTVNAWDGGSMSTV